MAQAFSNTVPAPEFLEADGRYDHKGYEARCEQYRADTKAMLIRLGYKSPVLGEVICFPVADGYAAYMLATPTKWIHLDEVDGYHASDATVRGTRAVDVKNMIQRSKAINAIFAR